MTVLYDEGCRFCTRLAAWLERQGGMAVEPIGSPTGDRALRDLTPAKRYASLHVLDAHGRRHSAAQALPPLLRALPALAWTAPVVELLPGPARWGYELVARHRGTLSRIVGAPAGGSPSRAEPRPRPRARRASRERTG
jgi:predicted DCC family thiol-disulfide oxidoreductase YuxK